MDEAIRITELNDFIFCPVSIYFHNLYGDLDKMLYQVGDQINGTHAHEKVDKGEYTYKKSVLMGMDVYCEKYNLIGKIDMYDEERALLRERKKMIKQIYDGYIFQLYAQYFSLIDMGYEVKSIQLYSMDDNKIYNIKRPEEDRKMFEAFENVIDRIKKFKLESFRQENINKCRRCIYEPACDRSVLEEEC